MTLRCIGNRQIIMEGTWKVCDHEYNTHTDGLSFDEAVALANELSELFGELYSPHPDPEYREPQPARIYNTRGVVDGWEDLFTGIYEE